MLKTIWNIINTLLAAFSLVAIVSCGSEQLAGGGIGGTGITSGTVTGFGSVFVNGVEFDTAGATRSVDDVVTISNGADDLFVMSQGMVVTVSGTVDANGITGSATSIAFDEIVEGPISNVPVEDADMTTSRFDVLGIDVEVSRLGTVFVNTDFDSIGMGDVIEVSGFYDTAGTLLATYIDKRGISGPGTVAEVHGIVSGFNGTDTFMIGAVTVTFNGATVFQGFSGGVANGQFVEASGVVSGLSVSADRIELEDSNISAGSQLSIEGVVTQFIDIGNFMVSGQVVNASNSTFSPVDLATRIANDSRVEVEGVLVSGVLVASEVEERNGSIELRGLVVSVDTLNNLVGVEPVSGQPAISVQISSQTQLEDDFGTQPFNLTNLNTGDEVSVSGIQGVGNSVNAAKLKRDNEDKFRIKAPVQAASGNNASGSITVLGVTFTTNGSTDFEDNNDQSFPNGGDDFYGAVMAGDLVEIEDKDPVNGIADEVELKN